MHQKNAKYFLKTPVKSERGSVLLFVSTVVVPMLFLLFTLSVDLGEYYSRTQRAQKIVDDASLYAHRFLPSQENARRAAQIYLSQNQTELGTSLGHLNIETSSDMVSIAYEGQSPLTFASWFSDNSGISYSVFARTRSTPLDVYLALDTSSYLAPSLQGNAWDDATAWPAASFFEHEKIFYKEDQATHQFVRAVDARVVTQQCFNSVFSREKEAGIKIYDILSSFNLNSIGLGFFPGYILPLDQARNVEKGGRRAGQDQFPGEASFDTEHGSLYSSNVYCTAAAERETTHDAYRFPTHNLQFATGINDPLKPANRIIPGTFEFDREYLPYMEARDVIWSRAVNPVSDTKIDEVLSLVHSSLMVAPGGVERQGLVDAPAKVAIVIAGDVPRIGQSRFPDVSVKTALSSEFDKWREEISKYKANVNLFYVVFPHQGINDPNWVETLSELDDYFAQINLNLPTSGKFTVKLLNGNDSQQISDQITALLLLEKRTVMLSR